MESFTNVAAVIRTWSNYETIQETVVRALGAGIEHVIVVVKDDDPKYYGAVEARLHDTIEANKGRITVLPMREGYSWSNALNYGFDEVRRLNLTAAVRGERQIEYVLNVSNEVLFDRSTVEVMMDRMYTDIASAIGTTFTGLQKGCVVPLGKSYVHPRNTMMMVWWQDYVDIGGFNPRCDALGGQEDLEWLMRLEQAGKSWFIYDLKVPLVVDVHHDQAKKEAREMKAITSILEMNAEIALNFAKALRRIAE